MELNKIGAIKTGNFTLKSGATSPIYIDLRLIISFPDLLKTIADSLSAHAKSLQPARLCGVPYTALPIATAMSLDLNIPMVMRRKEQKNYGTKNKIEGLFHPNETCVVIEDVVTTGSSILETVNDLREANLQIKHVIAVLDREQGGKEMLLEHGLNLIPLIKLSDILKTLQLEIPT